MDGTSHANGGATNGHANGVSSVGTVSDRNHATVDMTLVGKRIRRLHDQVCGQGQRVEVTRAGCADVCVMISKRELEAMEAALGVYASTSSHAQLCRQVAQLFADAGVVYRPQAYGAEPVRTFADDCA